MHRQHSNVTATQPVPRKLFPLRSWNMTESSSDDPILVQEPDLLETSRSHPHLEAGTRNSSAVDAAASRTFELQRQKRVACKRCRQAKLRCESLGHGNDACTRCRRMGKDCQIDVNYKRSNKRLKIDELVEQVQQLRNAIEPEREGGNADPAEFNVGPCTTVPLIADQVVRSPLLPQHARVEEYDNRMSFELSPEDYGRMTDPVTPDSGNLQSTTMLHSLHASSRTYFGLSATASRTLGHISLKDEQIDALFIRFFESYHHFLPILDPSLSPDDYFVRSPVLFWAIISIASRRYEDEPTLLASLSSHVMKLLWVTISAPPYSRFTVQATVLICTWPFPTSSLWTEPSFMLVSNAKSAAMQLGLHRPEIIQDFSRSKRRLNPAELQEAAKIWSAVYIVAQCITSTLGQFPLFTHDWTIDRACSGQYSLSEDMRHHLLIQRFSTRVSQIMSQGRDSPTGHPTGSASHTLLSVLEDDFVKLRKEIGGHLIVTNDIVLQCVSLELQIFYFFEPPGSDFRRMGLLRAYHTSMTLIGKVFEADNKFDLMRYTPGYICRMTLIAAFVLFKIANSSYSQYIDLDKCKHSYNSVLSVMRRASVEDNDLHGKSSKILTQIWSVQNTLKKDEEPSLSLNTRAGASVLQDVLVIWRGMFGGPVPGYQSPLYSTSREDIPLDGSVPLSLQEAYLGNDLEVNLQDPSWIWDVDTPFLLPDNGGSE